MLTHIYILSESAYMHAYEYAHCPYMIYISFLINQRKHEHACHMEMEECRLTKQKAKAKGSPLIQFLFQFKACQLAAFYFSVCVCLCVL